MAGRATVRYTYEDYLTIPEDTSLRHEIVDGELFVTAAPRFRHQQVVMNLAAILHGVSRGHDLGRVVTGPVAVHLHDEGVVEPDVIFVGGERLGIVDPEGAVHGPPDLVVEVLSPSNRDFDRGIKRKQYMEHGVRELWLVDADARVVEVWVPGEEQPEVVRGTLVWNVSGRQFDVALSEVFRS